MLGFYKTEKQKLVSVTSLLNYVFGIADELDQWTLKQAVLAVQRASKLKKLTQEEAKKIGLAEREKLLNKSGNRGTQIHQAIQNHHNGRSYELEEEDVPYFISYVNFAKEHTIEPILEEFRVNNYQYGYAGRLDFYGKLDGQLVLLDFKTSNMIRWTYGLQLAMYKKCLEDAGYKVDATYVVHISPRKRGSEPKAELIEFKYPFEAVKWAVGLFNLKLAFDPFIKWYERTDEGAIENEKALTKSRLESPELTVVQGQEQKIRGTSQTSNQIVVPPASWPQSSYPSQEGKQLLETIGRVSEFVEDYNSTHNTTQQETRIEQTSSHKTETQPESQPSVSPIRLEPGVVVHFEARSYRTPLEISPLPSAKDISVPPELTEPSSRPARRQKTDESAA